MSADFKVSYVKPDKPGIILTPKEIYLSVDTRGEEEAGVILYDENDKPYRYPFPLKKRNGTLAGVKISRRNCETLIYNYYIKDEIITDPYAPAVLGLEAWGGAKNQVRDTKGMIQSSAFHWKKDSKLRIPYNDSMIYGLNVRSFTMSPSSGVKHKGTFEGVSEKIPYLKSLGITAVELMPCYEYEECLFPEEAVSYAKDGSNVAECSANGSISSIAISKIMRLNCWGFQKGFYFAPKASYSGIGDPVLSFKIMVKSFHEAGIEVLMHFYFPEGIKQIYMLEVLKYWVTEYHVDGFKITGHNLPYRLFLEDEVLKDVKLHFGYLPEQEEHILSTERLWKNVSVDNGNFLEDMRRYLKGDEGFIRNLMFHQRNNPEKYAVIHSIADYQGFSLYDLVSYEYKHNEDNGEDNRDGSDINYSWNCGVEGVTRKTSVQKLRLSQMKNALALVMLSQGTPYLFAGDELANTREGNNNAYCQDNETGWVNWKENKRSAEILKFTKELINLRKNYEILHMPEYLMGMDIKGLGVPDISYHGVEAWKPDLGYMSRMMGIMLWGPYAEKKESSFYLAYNMHWEEHQMALPKLPAGMKWEKRLDTVSDELEELNEEAVITLQPRSIVVCESRKH